jgi:hypothetical protein
MDEWMAAARRAELARGYPIDVQARETPSKRAAQRGCIEWIEMLCRADNAVPRKRMPFGGTLRDMPEPRDIRLRRTLGQSRAGRKPRGQAGHPHSRIPSYRDR